MQESAEITVEYIIKRERQYQYSSIFKERMTGVSRGDESHFV